MESKKRKIREPSSRKGDQIDPNEVLAALGMDGFLDALTKDAKKKLLKKLEANVHRLAVEEVDEADPLAVLKIQCQEIYKKFRFLGEMLDIRIKPNKRGICGLGNDISVIVDDKLMDKAWDLLINVEGWKEKVKIKSLESFPWTKEVVHRKLKTTSKEKVKELLKFSGIDDPDNLINNHYFERADTKYSVRITNELKTDNVYERLKKEDDLKEKLGWDHHVNTNEVETVITLGDFVVPGAVISKKPKRSRCGYFIIEWKKSVFPNSRNGILRINCRYMILPNSQRYNN